MRNLYFTYENQIFESEEAVRQHIKTHAIWEDVASKLHKVYISEDDYGREYEDVRTDLSILEMESCFKEYVDRIIERIKLGESVYGIEMKEIGHKLTLWDSDASIESPDFLSITGWAQIREEEIIITGSEEKYDYKIIHEKGKPLSDINFTAYVIFTEEEWNCIKEHSFPCLSSTEIIFRDKFNDNIKENGFAINFGQRKD